VVESPIGRAEASAPLFWVKWRGFGIRHEAAEHLGESLGSFYLREVTRALKDLQAATGYRFVRALGVLNGDDRIARAPDDEDWEPVGQVETVASLDALTVGAHHTAQRRQKRLTTVAVNQ
jgi:hypothetical protein